MLSRRHIRIKILHALYGYAQNEGMDMAVAERNLMSSIDKIYELYLYELKAFLDIHTMAEDQIERKRNKKLPTEEDLNPNLKFVNNGFLKWLGGNGKFRSEIEKHKVTWGDEKDILRKLLKEFQTSDEYLAYMSTRENDAEEDQQIMKKLYGKWIVHSELIHQTYEDHNLHWADDLDAAQLMVSRTFRLFREEGSENQLPNLIKDDDDIEFARKLYRQSIVKSDEYQELIFDKAKNWESDRIALIDIILMKMALAEMVSFNEIPVKVTLNEYIELSKEYSTPKSGNFINGILDKIKSDLEEKGDIRKIGRGLL